MKANNIHQGSAGALAGRHRRGYSQGMERSFPIVIERCTVTGLYVGHVPGIDGAHSQGATVEELVDNLRETLELLAEDGLEEEPVEFVGIRTVTLDDHGLRAGS